MHVAVQQGTGGGVQCEVVLDPGVAPTGRCGQSFEAARRQRSLGGGVLAPVDEEVEIGATRERALEAAAAALPLAVPHPLVVEAIQQLAGQGERYQPLVRHGPSRAAARRAM